MPRHAAVGGGIPPPTSSPEIMKRILALPEDEGSEEA